MKHTLKFILIGLFCCLCNFTVQAQTRNRQYEEYIHKYKDLAIDEMKRYRIPATTTFYTEMIIGFTSQCTFSRS